MSTSRPDSYVSRGGEKLSAALDHFDLDVQGYVCADLGSHVGGFVDCLLRRGAGKVYSVDTCYGTLAWALRRDDRVVVLERTNAMHVSLPEPVDIVTVDVGWTPQAKVLPNVAGMLRQGNQGTRERGTEGTRSASTISCSLDPSIPRPDGDQCINRSADPLAVRAGVVSLIKPHYEAAYLERTGAESFGLVDGVLPDTALDRVMKIVLHDIAVSGWVVGGTFESPIRGHGGNREVLVLLSRTGGA